MACQDKSYVKRFVSRQAWRLSQRLWWALSPLASYAYHKWFASDYPPRNWPYMAVREVLWSYICGDGLIRSLSHGLIYLKPRL